MGFYIPSFIFYNAQNSLFKKCDLKLKVVLDTENFDSFKQQILSCFIVQNNCKVPSRFSKRFSNVNNCKERNYQKIKQLQ